MFPNLETEQARCGYTDEYVAERLGISLQEYKERKELGTFLPSDVVVLLKIYNKEFEYLFQLEEQQLGDSSTEDIIAENSSSYSNTSACLQEEQEN